MNSVGPRRRFRLRLRVVRAEDAVGGALVHDEGVDCQCGEHECVYGEQGTNLESNDEGEGEGENVCLSGSVLATRRTL